MARNFSLWAAFCLLARVAGLILIMAAGADAHAVLIASSPANNDILPVAQEKVLLRFNETVRVIRFSMITADGAAREISASSGGYRNRSVPSRFPRKRHNDRQLQGGIGGWTSDRRIHRLSCRQTVGTLQQYFRGVVKGTACRHLVCRYRFDGRSRHHCRRRIFQSLARSGKDARRVPCPGNPCDLARLDGALTSGAGRHWRGSRLGRAGADRPVIL